MVVEYASPAPVVAQLAAALRVGPEVIRRQLVSAGERVARLLALPANPIAVVGADVRVGGVAGLMRISPRCELEIAPKFLGGDWGGWREDFFFVAMLSKHGRLLPEDRIGGTAGERGELASLVARVVVAMFLEHQRRPLRTYRHAVVADFAVLDEVEAEDLWVPGVDGYVQRSLRFDRQNVFNATILAAARALLPEVTQPGVRKQLLRVTELLAPQMPARSIRARRVPARSQRWQSLYDLSVDVLRGFGVSFSGASLLAPGFMVDTWRAWEHLLTVAFRLAWGTQLVCAQRAVRLGVRTRYDVESGSSSRAVWVTPDLAVSAGKGLLVDAKYKGRVGEAANRISDSDLYEALAFATATSASQVILLYPAVARTAVPAVVGTATMFERVEVRHVVVIGMEVEVRGISRAGAMLRFASELRIALSPFANREE